MNHADLKVLLEQHFQHVEFDKADSCFYFTTDFELNPSQHIFTAHLRNDDRLHVVANDRFLNTPRQICDIFGTKPFQTCSPRRVFDDIHHLKKCIQQYPLF